MLLLLIISVFLFLLFGRKVEELVRRYVDEFYMEHPVKDPLVTSIITHIVPYWTGFITLFALMATMQQSKSLANIGDVVALVILCGTTIFFGYITKRFYDSSTAWEMRISSND